VPAALALATDRVVLAGRSPADFEPAAAVAEEHGLEVLEAVELDEAVGAAVAHGGVLVAHDPGGWRAPALLRSGLRARRPVLLVPSRLGARRAD
jgi:hypothetical protein